MFQLTGGIALRVYVGDLLEFQRTFEGQWIGRAAAEIKDITRPADFARETLGGPLAFERLCDRGRNRHELRNELCFRRLVNRLTRPAEGHREAGKNSELAREGLC